MNINLLYWIAGILLIAFIGLVIYLIYIKLNEGREPTDSPILLNFGHRYGNGHAVGIIDKFIKGNDRTGIVFYPRDIDYVEVKNSKKSYKIEPIKIWVENEKIETLPKSDLSNHRNIIIVYPKYAENLSKGLRNKKIGKAIMGIIEDLNKEKEENEIYRKRIENQNKFLGEVGGLGDIAEGYTTRMKETFDEAKKQTKDDKPFKQPSSTSSSST